MSVCKHFPGVCDLCGKDIYYDVARNKLDGVPFKLVSENSKGDQKTRDYFLCMRCNQINNQLNARYRLVMEAEE